MNILITLPKDLIEKIISGEKTYEMRKNQPKHWKIGVDGFFVVEKGTDKIRCWCRVDGVWATNIDNYIMDWFENRLCVSKEYIEKYAGGQQVYLWKIGKVVTLQNFKRDTLICDKNPQQFAYCPFSNGEVFGGWMF